MKIYTREELIALCEKAVVPVEKWNNRDTPDAQLQVAAAWWMLKSNCPFSVGVDSDDRTIWVSIRAPRFAHIECDLTDPENWTEDSCYIPTQARLDAAAGGDWYDDDATA